MNYLHNPAEIGAAVAAYAQGVRVEGAAKLLFISGQVGTLPDGSLAGDTEAQLEVCWKRIFAILADAGMTKHNIVKISTFLTSADDIGTNRKVRDRMLEGHLAASTMLIVSGLANPAWTCEIEAVAAA